jgi:hypothetical protein
MDCRSNEAPKHTPGPWGVLPYTGAGEFGDYAIVCDTRERDIAAVEEEADAQLIAAAPEMLEALKALLEDAIESEYVVHNNYCSPARKDEMMAKGYFADSIYNAIAAIAKAEGRQG